MAKTSIGRGECEKQRGIQKDQSGNCTGQVLGHVVGWRKARAAGTEGTTPASKWKDQGKLGTSGFCRATMESAKDWAQGPRDEKEKCEAEDTYPSILCLLTGHQDHLDQGAREREAIGKEKQEGGRPRTTPSVPQS